MLRKSFVKYHKTTALLAGLLSKFCFGRDGVFDSVILFLAFFVLLNCLYGLVAKKSFAVGFCFGVGFFFGSLMWITEAFAFVGLGGFAFPALFGLVLYLALYPALACFFTTMFQNNRVTQILFFSIFWVFFEHLRGIAFTGFPWNLVGLATIDIKYFCQIGDLVGIHGLSLIFLLILTMLTHGKTVAYALFLFVATISYGYVKIELLDFFESTEHENSILLVQPSISQENKVDQRMARQNLERHLALSGLAYGHLGQEKNHEKRLIIWPEAAFNAAFGNIAILEYIKSCLKNSSDMILSGVDRSLDGKLYNSFFVLNNCSNSNRFYDKRHLLPFGEFIPEFLLHMGLQKFSDGVINFSSGNGSRTFVLDGFDQFDVVICYEIIFPGEILDSPQSKWILNITNDAWFKETDGPWQHLRSVRMRAIEEGRPVVRCANHGVSCIIDCFGRILQKTELSEQCTIKSNVPKRYFNTIYSKYKNKPVFVLMFLLFCFAWFLKKRSKEIFR